MAPPCHMRPVPDMPGRPRMVVLPFWPSDCGRRSAARKATAALRSGPRARASPPTTFAALTGELPRPNLALHGPKPAQISSARRQKNGREYPR